MALEYERWRKETKRIYLSFMNHARALIKRHYSGVYYLFDREPDLVYYQTLFAAPAWPEYHYNRKTGKITVAGKDFNPDSVKNLRNCFLFIHEPVDGDAHKEPFDCRLTVSGFSPCSFSLGQILHPVIWSSSDLLTSLTLTQSSSRTNTSL